MNFCECNCGQKCKNRFVHGHNARGTHINIGKPSWNKGKTKMSCPSIARVSAKMLGNKNGIGNTNRKNCIPWNKGKTKETDVRLMSTSKTLMGHEVSEKTRKSISIAQTGRKHGEEEKQHRSLSLIGHEVSMETRQKIREKNKIRTKENWQDPVFRKKMNIAHQKFWSDEKQKNLQLEKMAGGDENRPTKPEKQLIEIVKKLSLQFEYTGDCSFFVGNINPDFVDHNRKIIIEFQGCYWHGCKKCFPNSKMENTFSRRQIVFKKYGHNSIEIWEHELKDLDILSKKLLIFQMCNILNRAASPGLFLGT